MAAYKLMCIDTPGVLNDDQFPRLQSCAKKFVQPIAVNGVFQAAWHA